MGDFIYESFLFCEDLIINKNISYDLIKIALKYKETQGFLVVAESIISNSFNI